MGISWVLRARSKSRDDWKKITMFHESSLFFSKGVTFWVAAVFHKSVRPLTGTRDAAVGEARAAGSSFRCDLGAGGRSKGRQGIGGRGKGRPTISER